MQNCSSLLDDQTLLEVMVDLPRSSMISRRSWSVVIPVVRAVVGLIVIPVMGSVQPLSNRSFWNERPVPKR